MLFRSLIRKVIETLRDQSELLVSALPEMTAQEDGFYLLNINMRNLLSGQEPQLWLSVEDYNNRQAAVRPGDQPSVRHGILRSCNHHPQEG